MRLLHGCRATLLAIPAWIAAAASSSPYGLHLDGRPVTQLYPAAASAVVLFFTASDCPIAKRYAPEIRRLASEYSRGQVVFWWVYPNPGDTADVIHQHPEQFSSADEVILDNDQRLVRMAHAEITPEAAIFVPAAGQLREVYHGRIDDRYISLGQERPRAQKHDLEDALKAVLAHRSVPASGGPPVGCSIVPLEPR